MKSYLALPNLLLIVAYALGSSGAFLSSDDELSIFETAKCSTIENDIKEILISSNPPGGTGAVPVMHIQFNQTRRMLISSTVVHDGWTKQNNLPAKRNYRKLISSEQNCPTEHQQQDCRSSSNTFEFTNSQYTDTRSVYKCRSWNRGHVTPLNVMKFSPDAMSSTNLCINLAPQDPYTNYGPWKSVEEAVQNSGLQRNGYVMTGVCNMSNSIDGGKTQGKEHIPDCYWKLYCYKNNAGRVVVVGFHAPNQLIRNDLEKKIREEHVQRPRSQIDIINASSVKHKFFINAWNRVALLLFAGRPSQNLPAINDCINQYNLAPEDIAEWQNVIRTLETTARDDCGDDYCEEDYDEE